MMNLKEVAKTDYKFLYQILKEREINTNISHKKMPTYKKHIDFVQSKPYSKWYIIYFGRRKIGSVYISKQNEIGIFIKKKFLKNGIGTKVLKIILEKNPRKQFLANINPKNKKSIEFFKKNGFKLLQQTYELQVRD